MSKPLELKVYETNSTGRYMCGDGVTYAAEAVNEFADWKRLTDTELAAEYWRHEGDYRMLTDGYAVESFGTESLVPGPSSEDRSRAQLDTLLRFATSPHYREESA